MGDDDDDDNTPRFNRGAIDIVMGLNMKRRRRREKLVERQTRLKAKEQKARLQKPLARGKGVEKMRDLGLGLNAYRGKKTTAPVTPVEGEVDSVHMLSY